MVKHAHNALTAPCTLIPLPIAFACVWDEDRTETWSHIPANLLNALRKHAWIADVEAEPSRKVRRIRSGLNRRLRQPLWVPHPWNFVLRRRAIERQMRYHRTPIALEINDLATLRTPYWVYRDMTWRQVAEYGGDSATGVIDPGIVQLHRWHEARVYRKARGVFTFSRWAARSVQEVALTRTVVVPPGVNAPVVRRTVQPAAPRLLFVGRAFERKGGPEVLEAVKLLRRRRDVRLDIVGPPPPKESEWPDGVAYHGALTPTETAKLFKQATLFVLPSRFEAYGIALLEALACGVPCVARAVCAMPEILQDGKWGTMVESSDPVDLAVAIEHALKDLALHERVVVAQDSFRLYYSWDRAALQMLGELLGDLGHSEDAERFSAAVPSPPR
jgi:glycosyltransferase involved in cell wall biosynthesis